jgi:tetratricopeptide (TPR) repeat protein
LRRSQDLGKEIGDRRVLCKARDRLGDYHLRFGRLREALLAAQVGLEDAEKLKNPTATANSLQTLGRIYLTTDQIEDARGVFQKAVELRGEGVEVLSRELGRVHLIRLLIEEGQSQQADELLAGCERSARECQLPLLDAQTKLWSFVNSWKKARQLRPELIAEARRLLEQHGYREALLELMLAHANVCVEAGRPGEAQGLLDELDGLRQDSENPDLSLECDYLRAWLLVAKDAAPAKAFILLREARKTAHNRSKMRLARRCQALLDTVQPLVRRGDPSEG